MNRPVLAMPLLLVAACGGTPDWHGVQPSTEVYADGYRLHVVERGGPVYAVFYGEPGSIPDMPSYREAQIRAAEAVSGCRAVDDEPIGFRQGLEVRVDCR